MYEKLKYYKYQASGNSSNNAAGKKNNEKNIPILKNDDNKKGITWNFSGNIDLDFLKLMKKFFVGCFCVASFIFISGLYLFSRKNIKNKSSRPGHEKIFIKN